MAYSRADLGNPSAFIFHHTGGRGSVAGVQSVLQQRGLGAQYVMDRDGNITQIGGAGASHIRPGEGAGAGLSNANTVGMEVIARDNKDVTPQQVAAAQRFIHENYPGITVYGHGEINPGHKQADEGMAIVNAIRQARVGQPSAPPLPPPVNVASLQVAPPQGPMAGPPLALMPPQQQAPNLPLFRSLPTNNLDAAHAAMGLTPQERALYMRHLTNLYGPGGVDNPNGSRSTLYQLSFENGGKTYNVPTVYDGRILKPDDAIARARTQGLDNFPSYGSNAEAEARYQKMHDFMERDTGDYFAQRQQQPQAQPAQASAQPQQQVAQPQPAGQAPGQSIWSLFGLPAAQAPTGLDWFNRQNTFGG